MINLFLPFFLTAETLSSLGENNANSPIVDNLISMKLPVSSNKPIFMINLFISFTLALLEGNNNNLNNYFMVDNTENLLGRSMCY